MSAQDSPDTDAARREVLEGVVRGLTAYLLEIDPSSLAAPAAAPPGSLRGRDPDEVSAALLALIAGEAAEQVGGERVDRVAAELMRLIEKDGVQTR